MKKFSTAFCAADILLPNESVDMKRWAVIACDQFTSQPEYWNEVNKIVGNAPSTLRLILPEVYIDPKSTQHQAADIHSNMKSYLNSGIFREYKQSMIYVERTDSTGNLRCGVVGAIDLEQYDYNKGSVSPVRATEATVVERIPPRVKIRAGALLELPHIMILVDDPEKTAIEKLSEEKSSLERLYSFELMEGGGKIEGYLLGEKETAELDHALARLAGVQRTDTPDEPVLLYAMGDGNHSLAAAKAYYEQLKSENPNTDMSTHPARYALAEIVNLHSEALEFEAIHRIITGVDTDNFIGRMTDALGLTENGSPDMQSFDCIVGSCEKRMYITKPQSNLTVGSVQQFIDAYLNDYSGSVDYIHGRDIVQKLSQNSGSVGIILPDMKKEELFPTVIKDGALPRKTFSMGHAKDKRYYIECRRIVTE